MSQFIPTLTDDDILAAVRSFLLAYVMPPGGEVVGDVDNLVAPPGNPYVVMNHLTKPRLSTNVSTYDYSVVGTYTVATQTITQPTQYGLQLDCVDGTSGGDLAQVISTIWRDSFAEEFLNPLGVAPLYTDDPRHAPWVNGENQWESRWIVNVYMQVNPSLLLPTSSYGHANVGIVDVDGTIHS